MRHLKAGKRLGVTSSHRKALMRNLVTALLEHGEIKTTVTRAKEMRRYFDRMISFGKKGDLHARRQVLSFVKSREAVKKLFEEYGPLYIDRNGGYTRIYRIGSRLGDNAQMALIQMVGLDKTANKEQKPKTEERISEIKTELQKNDAKPGIDVAAQAETQTSQAAQDRSDAVASVIPESPTNTEKSKSDDPSSL